MRAGIWNAFEPLIDYDSTKCFETGTNLTRLAGFRACPCLENFYRLDRFGKCIECPLGYQCTNETVRLLPEFYWIWKNESSKERYKTFTEVLQQENKYHDPNWRIFNERLPIPYICPFVGSCKVRQNIEFFDSFTETKIYNHQISL